jgi:hypothetical protein
MSERSESNEPAGEPYSVIFQGLNTKVSPIPSSNRFTGAHRL